MITTCSHKNLISYIYLQEHSDDETPPELSPTAQAIADIPFFNMFSHLSDLQHRALQSVAKTYLSQHHTFHGFHIKFLSDFTSFKTNDIIPFNKQLTMAELNAMSLMWEAVGWKYYAPPTQVPFAPPQPSTVHVYIAECDVLSMDNLTPGSVFGARQTPLVGSLVIVDGGKLSDFSPTSISTSIAKVRKGGFLHPSFTLAVLLEHKDGMEGVIKVVEAMSQSMSLTYITHAVNTYTNLPELIIVWFHCKDKQPAITPPTSISFIPCLPGPSSLGQPEIDCVLKKDSFSNTHLLSSQRSVDLMRKIIRTGVQSCLDCVLSICSGTGTDLVAAVMEGCHCVGFEQDPVLNIAASHRLQALLKYEHKRDFSSGYRIQTNTNRQLYLEVHPDAQVCYSYIRACTNDLC